MVWHGEFMAASTFQKAAQSPASRSTAQGITPPAGDPRPAPCPAQGACCLPLAAWQSHTALSQLQVLQVSPAGANFHFNIQIHWEFDGVFHLMFHDLSNLEENIRHQTQTQPQCSGFLSILGQTSTWNPILHLFALTYQTSGNTTKSWLVLMSGETV